MNTLSCHVLDTATGRPAAGLMLHLAHLVQHTTDEHWAHLSTQTTDADGRVRHWDRDTGFPSGTYRVRFETGDYFARYGLTPFYPWVDVVFTLHDAHEHTHIPLLLSPFGYTSYRGS